jgi:hypothetical protein
MSRASRLCHSCPRFMPLFEHVPRPNAGRLSHPQPFRARLIGLCIDANRPFVPSGDASSCHRAMKVIGKAIAARSFPCDQNAASGRQLATRSAIAIGERNRWPHQSREQRPTAGKTEHSRQRRIPDQARPRVPPLLRGSRSNSSGRWVRWKTGDEAGFGVGANHRGMELISPPRKGTAGSRGQRRRGRRSWRNHRTRGLACMRRLMGPERTVARTRPGMRRSQGAQTRSRRSELVPGRGQRAALARITPGEPGRAACWGLAWGAHRQSVTSRVTRQKYISIAKEEHRKAKANCTGCNL